MQYRDTVRYVDIEHNGVLREVITNLKGEFIPTSDLSQDTLKQLRAGLQIGKSWEVETFYGEPQSASHTAG